MAKTNTLDFILANSIPAIHDSIKNQFDLLRPDHVKMVVNEINGFEPVNKHTLKIIEFQLNDEHTVLLFSAGYSTQFIG